MYCGLKTCVIYAVALISMLSPAMAAWTSKIVTIGDMGRDSSVQRAVTDMIINKYDTSTQRIDGLVTTGDNNYPSGRMDVMDKVVGKYYSRWMYPYKGNYAGKPSAPNKFWPVLGNHDWGDGVYKGCNGDAGPYLSYMPVNGQRYYNVVIKDVHFFMIDSDCNERSNGVAGSDVNGYQAQWLKSKLAASTAAWKIVVFHHPPYSSGDHGSTLSMRWPFQQWGAHAVINGHDHSYERIVASSDFPYFVNGAGGGGFRSFGSAITGSKVRYANNGGAQLIQANKTSIQFKFHSAMSGYPRIDCYRINKRSIGGLSYQTC